MAFATRLIPASLAEGRHAIDGPPVYHDECVPRDDDGFARADALGRDRVWLGRGPCGYDEYVCAACGALLKHPAGYEPPRLPLHVFEFEAASLEERESVREVVAAIGGVVSATVAPLSGELVRVTLASDRPRGEIARDFISAGLVERGAAWNANRRIA